MDQKEIVCDCGGILDATGVFSLDEVVCTFCERKVPVTPRRVKEAQMRRLRGEDGLASSSLQARESLQEPWDNRWSLGDNHDIFPFPQIKGVSSIDAAVKSTFLAFQQCQMISLGEELGEAFRHFVGCGLCMKYGVYRLVEESNTQLHPFLQGFLDFLLSHPNDIRIASTLSSFLEVNRHLLFEEFHTYLRSADQRLLGDFIVVRKLSRNINVPGPELPSEPDVSVINPAAPPPRPRLDIFPDPQEGWIARMSNVWSKFTYFCRSIYLKLNKSANAKKENNTKMNNEMIEGSKMPEDLAAQFMELEEWAQANRKDARNGAIAFWVLKLPAIISSASAGLFAYFSLTVPSLVTSTIATFCILIDGIHPRGLLRNTHLRAYHDIRILMATMTSKWRARSTSANPQNIARKIIKEGEDERQRIASYIRDAETALKEVNEIK